MKLPFLFLYGKSWLTYEERGKDKEVCVHVSRGIYQIECGHRSMCKKTEFRLVLNMLGYQRKQSNEV